MRGGALLVRGRAFAAPGDREPDFKGRAAFVAVPGGDGAAEVLDQPVDDGKAEAGALSDGLGGEEGFENLVQQMGGDAGAGIPDGQEHGVAFRSGADAEHEVDDDLFEPVGDGEHGGQLRRKRGFQRDAVHHELAAEQIAGSCDHGVDVRVEEGEVGLAPEGSHVVDDVAGAVHLPVDLRGQLGERFRGDGLVAADFAQEVAGRALDDGERLIQFVGHAGGHFPEGRHLARLNELLLHLDAFGDVRGAQDADRAVLDPRRGGPDVHAQGRAVGPDVGHAGKDGEGAELRGVLLAFLGQEQVEDAAADQFLARAAVHFDGGGVAVGDGQLGGVEQEDGVGDAIEDGLVGPLGGLQLVLEGMDERHVDAHFHDRGDVAVAVEEGDGLDEPVVARAVGVDPAFLIALDDAFVPCADDGAFGTGRGAVLVDFVAGLPRLRGVAHGEAVVPAEQVIVAVLYGDAAGHHVEQPLEVVLAAAHFFELVLVADAEFDDGVRELAELVVAAGVVEGDGLSFAHGLHAGDHAADGQAHLIPVEAHGDGAQKQRDGGQDDPQPFEGHQPEYRSHPGKKQQRRHGDGLHHEAVGSESASHRRPPGGSGGSRGTAGKQKAYSPSIA